MWKLALMHHSAKFRLYCRSSHRKMFYERSILKNFSKLAKEHLSSSVSPGLQLTTQNSIKKRLCRKCFLIIFHNSKIAEQLCGTGSDKPITCFSEVLVYKYILQ